MSILDIKDLSIRFGGVQALKNVSFSVDDGEFVGLMGPNGAGKTTVINCLSRIYNADSGRAFFMDRDLLKLGAHQISEVGIVRTFQDLNFFGQIPDMSILDYLKLGQLGLSPWNFLKDGLKLRSSRENEFRLKSKARKVLEFFRSMREQMEPPQEERGYPVLFGRGGFPDLIDLEDSPISSLSFAWRRRVDLARALVSNPRLMLLDEPAQGLPPSEIENLGEILRKIQSEFKVAAVIVEHSVSMLMKVSGKIVAMDYGEVIAQGAPAEIAANKRVNEIYIGTTQKSQETTFPESAIQPVPVKSINESPILEVRNLDLFYGQAQALSSVSIQMFPRQIASVLGSNGSGKSSLLRAISGLARPSNGEILLNGEYLPLGWPEVAVERGIQYVPQGHVIFPQLTVSQNLKLGAYAFEKRGLKCDTSRVFNYFPELERVQSLQANDLSGGQRQMLAIGQAIIGRPIALLLDEPSLGLSPKFVETLFEIIQRISVEEQCAILLVEQNVTKALEISNYIFMMNSGVLISEGSAAGYRENINLVKKNLGFL